MSEAHIYNAVDALILEEMARGPGPTPITDSEIPPPRHPSKPSKNTEKKPYPALEYSYQAHELINLELMKRHEANLWRAYNQDSDQSRASIVLAGQALADGLEQTNVKRKREEEENIRELDTKRRQLYKLMGSVQSVRRALD
jgi:hypothetical protein